MKFNSFLDEQILNEGINDVGIFKAVFMSGIPGAGKSTVLTKIKSGSVEPRIVNVDRFTEFLNITDIFSVYDKSKQLTKNQLTMYLNGILPLFVDTTGYTIGRLKNRINILERLGYDTMMIFINTSLETSLKRASKRTRKVAPSVIEEYYEKAIKFKEDIRRLFPLHFEINNDDGELTDDVVLKAFKKTTFFYESQIQNPIGKKRYELMVENGWKYLSPNITSIEEIKSDVDIWFGK